MFSEIHANEHELEKTLQKNEATQFFELSKYFYWKRQRTKWQRNEGLPPKKERQ